MHCGHHWAIWNRNGGGDPYGTLDDGHSRMKRLLLAGLLVLVSACEADAALSSGRIDLDEFYIEPAASTWMAGRVEFEVFNEGEFAHTMVISTEDGTAVITSTLPIAPGETENVAVTLPAGKYMLTCRIVQQIPDGTFVDHFERGMRTTITVVNG